MIDEVDIDSMSTTDLRILSAMIRIELISRTLDGHGGFTPSDLHDKEGVASVTICVPPPPLRFQCIRCFHRVEPSPYHVCPICGGFIVKRG